MAIKFCAQCGNELTLQMESGRERPMCPRCGLVVYRNPAPVGMVLATQDDKLLLVHRLQAPLAGYWAPPTGYIEMDESVEEGTARETREETGLDVTIDRLLGLYSRANAGITMAVYAGHVVGGALAFDEHEVDQVCFFARAELPQQPAPANDKLLDQWFYALIEKLFAEFRLTSKS